MDTFFSLGLSRAITDCLAREGITTPTRIQLKAIPAALKGADVIGRSQTGTGKTLAYLLPLIHRIRPDDDGVQALIMTPTRELARQVFDVLRPFAETLGLDAVDVIGGRTIENQLRKLKRSPHFIIGTPGRLLDHIRRRAVDLTTVRPSSSTKRTRCSPPDSGRTSRPSSTRHRKNGRCSSSPPPCPTPPCAWPGNT